MQKLRIKQIQTFRSEANKQYYLRIIGKNSQTVFPSEGYKRKAGRDNAVDIINQSLLAPVPVVAMEWVSQGKTLVLRPARALVNQTKVAKVKRAPKKR